MTTITPNTPWWRTLTKEHWFVFTIASLAWLFDCLDQQLFNLARDGAMEGLVGPVAAKIKGPYTTSVFLLGWATGGLIFGALGDRYGRAKVLTGSILLYSLCTGLSCLSTGFFDFCVYRFLTGVGVGGVFGLAVALVADTVPDKARAPALGMLQSLSTLGNITAALLGMGIGAVAVLPLGLKPWQAMFLIGALPAFLCVFVMGRLKEPQKWIDARDAGALKGVKLGSYAVLLRHPKWKRHAWYGLIACSAGIIGLWGIGNFHPTIVGSIVETHFKSLQLTGAELASKKALWRSVGLLLQNVGAFVGMMTFAHLAQTKGRKFAFALALLVSFLSTLLVFKGLREFSQIFWMLPIMGFGQLSVFAVFAIYLPELFPTSLRSTGVSFCYNVGRILAATAPFTISKITASLGGDIESFRTAGVWVSLVLLLGIAVLPLLPETKDQPLPEE
ncbi:MAG: MFS transporter [Undibacterium sp.]|nr:MFS transporter [Opitutaceae bacterium]